MTGSIKDLAAQGWQTLLDVSLPNQPGQVSVISMQAAQAIAPLKLPADRHKKLIGALRRAVENATHPARERRPADMVTVCVLAMTAGQGGWNFFLVEQVSSLEEGDSRLDAHMVQLFLYQDDHA